MDGAENEVIDSQIIAENVGFLNDCFDNSFALQSSIIVAKEYISETHNTIKNTSKCKNLNNSQNKTSINTTVNCSQILKPPNKEEKISKYLSHWGLPVEIVKKYYDRGIKEMFDWQVSCLGNSKVLLDCCNLVYSAPTSAGKTLVAEILTIKTVLERQKKVIIILPFVSIVREKMFYLQDILSSSGIRVEGFMGSQSPPGGLQAVHVAICTIEKANSLVNRLLDEGNISELGAVIVDELHLLGDPHRGYILELLLTKIKYVSSKNDLQIQIIGMSATLPNLKVLADWLDAELFVTQFRPIPLDEYCLVGRNYYDKDGKHVNAIKDSEAADCVLHICLDTIKEGCSVLIFCMTKNRCESLAQNIASSFFKLGSKGVGFGCVLREQLKTDYIVEVLEQLKNCPVGLDNVLKGTISFGVAYHHAGLTFDERDIIEGGFKSGAIKVLVATSTLSSGVNLPARKVIIRTPVFQKQPINILTYKQMIGRAGRMGKDIKGESILVCTEAERNVGFNLMMGTLEPVKSCIESEDKFMRAILEMIASDVACTVDELNLYAKCTLLFTQEEVPLSQKSLLENTLDELKNYELIRIQDGDCGRYVATSLGKACLSSSMAPNDGLTLFCELQRARQCLVLENDLHLIYLVTPYSVSSQWGDIDWLHLLSLWESLTKAMKKVGELIGVQESFIIRCVRGPSNKLRDANNKLNIHKRFYTALALQDLVNEVPLSEVAVKFQCARGFLQSLQQAAATFAGMVTVFSRQLGWKNMEMLVSQFQDRLHFGIHSELLELMKLPTLNGLRARSLYDSGLETIISIASADKVAIENALIKAVPFQSEKQRDNDDCSDIRKRNKIKNIWITGNCGLTPSEAAEKLITEARQFLQREIGVNNINWSEAEPDNKEQSFSVNNEVPKDDVNKSQVVTAKELDQSEVLNYEKNDQVVKEETIITEINAPNAVLSVQIANSSQEYHEKTLKTEIITQIHKEMPNQTVVEPKEDIMWDSLNISEVPLTNIIKLKDSPKSPEISFSDNDDKGKMKFLSAIKDLSLFSTDDDNSSLFEDSLPIDSVNTNVIEERNVKTDNTAVVNESKVDNEGFTVNSTTLLNAFQSTLIDTDEDDLHLVYEDDTSQSDKEFLTTKSVPSQRNVRKRSNNASDINPPTAKKIKSSQRLEIIKDEIDLPKLINKQSKKFTVDIGNSILNCYVLKYEDILGNIHVIQNIKEASMIFYFDLKNKSRNEVIGLNVLKGNNHRSKNDYSKDTNTIILYFGTDYAISFDLSTCNDLPKLSSFLEKVFRKNDMKLHVLSIKQGCLHCKKHLGIDLPEICHDVCIAEWLGHMDEKEISIEYLIKKYCHIDLVKVYKKDILTNLFIKSWAVWNVAVKQKAHFRSSSLDLQKALDTEMSVSKILALSEYYGIAVDKNLASQLLTDSCSSQTSIQKHAYKICGRPFNFNSSKAVAEVLGIYRGKKVSTKKSVLSSHDSPISSVIIYWRKLNSILTKTLYPLTEKAVLYTENDKIKPTYTTYTCTGRVSMHEPNLQNVPRTFTIPYHYLNDSTASNDVAEFNCRNIFVASKGYVFVSADYCQLEMRILTHFCSDPVLTDIMRSDMDVFKSIAASWSCRAEDEVDDDLRQKAKQLCYGIIYGMGNKTLSQTLDVSEMEAAVFMDTFHKTYPKIKEYTQSVIDKCAKEGFIETLMKRRRYLPDIKSIKPALRCAAERQAVNTTIQGSAADIAKAAMCKIYEKTLRNKEKPRLVLQMHDELIYEVPMETRQEFANLLKNVMENTVKLNVPLPVKVKSGPKWGSLDELKL